MSARVAFVDRDGTLIEEPPDFQVDSLSKLRLAHGVVPALRKLQEAGFELVMVSNQDGLGTDSFPREDFDEPHEFLMTLLASQGIEIAEVFVCPHVAKDGCECRKPRTGLVNEFMRTRPVDRDASVMIGDRDTDLQFADNLGVRGFRVDAGQPGSWEQLVREIVDAPRIGRVRRETRETDLSVEVDLDAPPGADVATGIGFFDHMLEQLAKHGGFGLKLSCKGDLEVDEHHTVEDCALALGAALKDALGDRRGISRFASELPMDEADVKVLLDLSGRPWLKFRGKFARESVGGLPTELVEHFFRSLAEASGATLHIRVRGENTHHMIESCFKGVGRALRQAVAREGGDIPSTKGVL
ncbi:MAG: bifunctional histidinol-phosphatase/imidazoleglycerol-phosphate dehydratase HisB [Gammaproteobacteria bacterium]|nr:bifunctional histidinol-phosphatase/imidazoleglycerol-phosphate dehydratase HisB [Gammaproteobacteria bacterium]